MTTRTFVHPGVVAVLLAITLLVPMATPAPALTPPVPDSAVSPLPALQRGVADEVRKGIRGCVNRKRIKHGLRPLKLSAPLEKAAGLHAVLMKKKNFFGHIDPSGRNAADRVALFASRSRYTPIGENIAAGYNSSRRVCKAWMNSAGHRANILDPRYNAIGAGFARGGNYGTYFVQVFGRED